MYLCTISRATTMLWTRSSTLACLWDWETRDMSSLVTYLTYTSSMKGELHTVIYAKKLIVKIVREWERGWRKKREKRRREKHKGWERGREGGERERRKEREVIGHACSSDNFSHPIIPPQCVQPGTAALWRTSRESGRVFHPVCKSYFNVFIMFAAFILYNSVLKLGIHKCFSYK